MPSRAAARFKIWSSCGSTHTRMHVVFCACVTRRRPLRAFHRRPHLLQHAGELGRAHVAELGELSNARRAVALRELDGALWVLRPDERARFAE